MKRSVYIGFFGLLFLILSCNFPTESEPEPEGCYSIIPGSGLVFDECGVCEGDNYGDNIYTDDVCGTCSVNLWGECYNIQETTHLDLRGYELTGEIPPEIENLMNLKYLYLWGNELIGEIPSEIGNLTNLVLLGLHKNQLTGEIPPEIGNLINLSDLYLYDNQLTGEIPPEIGNLTNLTSFGLGGNQLTGEIPEEICNQGDSTPNVGSNQLCPPYPSCLSQSDIGEQDTSNCP